MSDTVNIHSVFLCVCVTHHFRKRVTLRSTPRALKCIVCPSLPTCSTEMSVREQSLVSQLCLLGSLSVFKTRFCRRTDGRTDDAQTDGVRRVSGRGRVHNIMLPASNPSPSHPPRALRGTLRVMAVFGSPLAWHQSNKNGHPTPPPHPTV